MSLGMQKIQFEGIDAKQKCSKQNKMISNKRLHSATYLRLQLVILLCLLPSKVILTVCYVKMFPRIGENGSVTEHTTHQNLPYSDTFSEVRRKCNDAPTIRGRCKQRQYEAIQCLKLPVMLLDQQVGFAWNR